jgi:hypothetical protein
MCTLDITYIKLPEIPSEELAKLSPAFCISANPINWSTINAMPNRVVALNSSLNFVILFFLNSFIEKYMVALLISITNVEIQNEVGIENSNQFPCALRTKKALVQPANIIQILAIPIHMSNLCEFIFLFSVEIVDIIIVPSF